MSSASGPGVPAPPPRGGFLRGRKLLLGLVAGLVAAVLVVVVIVGSRDDGGSTDAGASATSSPTGTSSTPPETPAAPSTAPQPTPSAQPTGSAGADDELPPALPAVALDQPVAVGAVTASLTDIEEITGQATGPGDVAGPALRVTVRIQNGTKEAIPLDGVSVNAYYRADLTPAPPLNDPTVSPFHGSLSAGEAAEGVYVFRVPADQRSEVTFEVGYRPGASLAIFSGAV
jgi:hypothetical protein